MLDSMRYDRELSKVEMQTSQSSSSTDGAPSGVHGEPGGKTLCCHDGVLLKKAGAEYISHLNTSGSLSIVEMGPPRCLYLEWRPTDNILIADDSQDQEDWALVDTISQRTRTTSECKVFNVKPPSSLSSSIEANGAMTGSVGATKTRLRARLDELHSIQVLRKGQIIRFLRKDDEKVHSEYFFQHGNADCFVMLMRQLHIIEALPMLRNGEEYLILPIEAQKLKKTFAELDIGEIKASAVPNEGWLPTKVKEMFVTLPEYLPSNRVHKQRHGAIDSLQKLSPDNYQMVGMSGSNTTTASSSSGGGSQSRGSSLDKSPGDGELVEEVQLESPLPPRKPVQRGPPLSETQWLEFITPEGCVSDPSRVSEIIFRGGIQPHLRAEVWKYLLNYHQWGDTTLEKIERQKQKAKEYYTMKAQWLSMTATQEANFAGYRDRKCQIEKDVKRTDRSLEYFAGEDNPHINQLQGILQTYVMYNFDLGYVQGMSDLLAPILAVQCNEVDAFWCFVGFMDMVYANFDEDQAGMKTQFQQVRALLEFANPRLFNYMRTHESDNMYFCFRWLLVWFKRELSNDDVLKLWECLWTRLPCPNFHVLMSVAILDQQTDIIIDNQYEFTEILKHVNELSGHLDLPKSLEVAEAIYVQLKEAENLPNNIREIIGEPLLETEDAAAADEDHQDFDDGFDELVRELTPEERRLRDMELEEAYERSMFLQHL